LHHISVLEACITRIKLNMVVARNCCQLQFNLASTNLQPKAFCEVLIYLSLSQFNLETRYLAIACKV
jgi:hypothetical protein